MPCFRILRNYDTFQDFVSFGTFLEEVNTCLKNLSWQVHVDPGMKSNQKFTFYGEGDQEPGREAGDVIIQLEEKPHSLFQRHGADLAMKMDLELSEALCGLQRVVKTLDDRNIVISTPPGQVIKHSSTKMIEGEGFPHHRDPFNKGRLIIVFAVDFPDSLSRANADKIRSALPKVAKATLPTASEDVKLLDFDGQGEWRGGMEDEENGNEPDADHFQGGPQAQCAQQ